MSHGKSQFEIVGSRPTCCNLSSIAVGLLGGIALTLMLATVFWLGRQSASDAVSWNGIPMSQVPPELLSATATHGGANLAVCTAQVGDDAEGFFSLDFTTGELKGWVYYPKQGAFGGMFMTNVQLQLGQSKNPEYLLVSGSTMGARLTGNVKLAQSLIYVVDTRSGLFAAYTAPWNSSLESSAGTSQGGQMIFMSGGQIRESSTGVKKPIAPMPGAAAPGAKVPGNLEPSDPNKPANKKPK
jgi:hypothetical protein